MVSPTFLWAASVEQHLCMDAIPARPSAPPCTLLRGPVRTLQLGAALLGLGTGFLGTAPIHSPQLCRCAPHRAAARTPPCTAPARSWVMRTLLDIRAQSPCTELTVPHAPSLHSMLVHVSNPALVSTRTLLPGTVWSLYSTPSSSFGIARVLLFPVSLCRHWTHPFCENL